MDRSWFTQESNGRKPDWLGLSSSFSSIYLKRELNISLSKILQNISKIKLGDNFLWDLFLLFCELEQHLLFSRDWEKSS